MGAEINDEFYNKVRELEKSGISEDARTLKDIILASDIIETETMYFHLLRYMAEYINPDEETARNSIYKQIRYIWRELHYNLSEEYICAGIDFDSLNESLVKAYRISNDITISAFDVKYDNFRKLCKFLEKYGDKTIIYKEEQRC